MASTLIRFAVLSSSAVYVMRSVFAALYAGMITTTFGFDPNELPAALAI